MAERTSSDRNIVDQHLARAWKAVAPPPGLEAQVRARLTGSSAATMGAVALGMASNARPTAWASLQASGRLGALVGAGLLGLGLVSGYSIRDAQLDAPAAPVPASAAILSAPAHAPAAPPQAGPAVLEPVLSEPSDATATLSAQRSPVRAPVRAAQRQAPASDVEAASQVAPATRPEEELALLRRADRAVRADNAALALALVAELEARYPDSRLLEERRAIELMAYCRVGASDARARAQRFLREHASSVYAGRVRETCPNEGTQSTDAPR